MPAIVFALAIAALIAVSLATPTEVAVERAQIREALGKWALALQSYRAANCQLAVTSVSEAILIEDGFLAGPIHPEIVFAANITVSGTARSLAIPRDSHDSSVLTKAWVATEGVVTVKDGQRVLNFHTNEYSQGGSPPGFATLISFDNQTTECKQ